MSASSASSRAARRTANPTGFFGIALADILANGVAVIILLITIIIADKYQAEQKKLEQADEIAVVLSRDLANSVVMNNLAASAPAMLHDYENSPLDVNPDHSIMPVLELHQTGVRHFYTGEFWTRGELLRQDNGLDTYLTTLTAEQRARLRTDVYEVAQFYLYRSLMQVHEVPLFHWHFSVYDPGDGTGAGDGTGTQQQRTAARAELQSFFAGLGGEEGAREGDSERGNEEGNAGDTGNSSDFNDRDHRGAAGGRGAGDLGGQPWLSPYLGGGYPLDTQLLSREQQAQQAAQAQAARAAARAGARSAAGQNSDGTTGSPDGTGSQRGGVGTPSENANPRPRRIRLASGEAFGPPQSGLPADDYVLLVAMLSTLKYLQGLVDAEQSPVHAIRTLTSLFMGFANQSLPLTEAEQVNIDAMLYRLQEPTPELTLNHTIPLQLNPRPYTRAQLIAAVNTALYEVQIEHPEPLASSARVNLLFNEYPEIYQGLNIELMAGSTLFTPQYASDDEYRWRAVAFVYPQLDDFVVGFLYAAIATDGALVLPADENGISIDGYPWTVARVAAARTNLRLLWIFSAVLIVLLLLLYWRTRRGDR